MFYARCLLNIAAYTLAFLFLVNWLWTKKAQIICPASPAAEILYDCRQQPDYLSILKAMQLLPDGPKGAARLHIDSYNDVMVIYVWSQKNLSRPRADCCFLVRPLTLAIKQQPRSFALRDLTPEALAQR